MFWLRGVSYRSLGSGTAAVIETMLGMRVLIMETLPFIPKMLVGCLVLRGLNPKSLNPKP